MAGVKGFPEVVCAATTLTSSAVPTNVVCFWLFSLGVSSGWRAGKVAPELHGPASAPLPLQPSPVCFHPPPLQGTAPCLPSCLLCP